MAETLAERGLAVLLCPLPEEKAKRTRTAVEDWRAGRLAGLGRVMPSPGLPSRPARPERPPLRPPREVAKRRLGPGPAGRIALLHALAHIELNAIDLAWDILLRFPEEDLPPAFTEDWLKVAGEEARHFLLLSGRLASLGAAYGDLPAHDGLWQAAEETAHDLLARLAVVPLVLEARGLDVTPAMIARLEAVGDARSAEVLRIIHEEEIGHVAAGRRWFLWLADRRSLEPRATWQALVRRHFRGQVKPPFNRESRARAGLSEEDYLPLAPVGPKGAER